MANPDRTEDDAGTAVPAQRSHRERPTWTQCTGDCVKPTPAQAHCTVCHRTFGGVSNFDKHRRDGWCIDPSTLGMTLNDNGVWRVPLAESEQQWWRSK